MKLLFLFLYFIITTSLVGQSIHISKNEVFIRLNEKTGTINDSIVKSILSNDTIRNYYKMTISNVYIQLPDFVEKLNWMHEITLGGVFKKENGDTVVANFIISDEFNDFDSLKILKFYGVGINKINDNFNPPYLKELIIMYDRLATIPQPIFNCIDLQRLILSRNEIISIPIEIQNLKQIDELDLSHNQLSDIPSELFQLSKIQIITFEENNISHLSDSICLLYNLQILNVIGNRLSVVPKCISSMPSIKSFNCDLEGKSF